MRILTLTQAEHTLIEQAATLLVEGFAEHSPEAWPTMQAAREEVQECLATDRILLGAVDDQGKLLDWRHPVL